MQITANLECIMNIFRNIGRCQVLYLSKIIIFFIFPKMPIKYEIQRKFSNRFWEVENYILFGFFFVDLSFDLVYYFSSNNMVRLFLQSYTMYWFSFGGWRPPWNNYQLKQLKFFGVREIRNIDFIEFLWNSSSFPWIL